ncbi:MAG TPA: thiamine biosynthesis protein ApbE [Microscillaceae bacterium]|jgi:thiamine biosynthesis lipoprotein|nr:thiamine biosynthesis protein ApbE [Microscillaceae bacterium]
MNNVQKNIIYSVLLLASISAVYLYRAAQRPVLMEIRGEAMGTTYQIKYLDYKSRQFKSSVDSLLLVFNQSLSTYQKDTEISAFNQDSAKTITFKLPFFYPVLAKSLEIYKATDGAFDPTVAPLVNAWGFGFKTEKFPDSSRVDTLRRLVGFEKINFDKNQVTKLKKGVMLDFNAIAQGYGVDVVAQFFEKQGIQNYMIEIGGEVLCKGKNAEDKFWSIGIANPTYEASGGSPTQAIVQLENKALATSGNYRKFYIIDKKKYSHTVNPKTGYPVQHSLLSATVIAKDCMSADAYATAFMVMGLDKAKQFLAQNPSLDAYFVYANADGSLATYMTKGLEKSLQEVAPKPTQKADKP